MFERCIDSHGLFEFVSVEFDPLLDQNQSPTRQAPMQDIARADEYLCFKFSKASVKMRRRVIGVIHGNDDAGWVGPLASEGGQETLPRSLLKFSGGQSSFRPQPDRTIRV